MNKQSIEKVFGDKAQFLTITDIAKAMSLDRGTVRQILNGVPYIPVGKKKLYLTTDVAEVLYRRRA